jgi:hypothetical protein
MERIEPINPSSPPIAPIDTTGVKVRAPGRERNAKERRRREERARREREQRERDHEPPQGGRVDVQA